MIRWCRAARDASERSIPTRIRCEFLPTTWRDRQSASGARGESERSPFYGFLAYWKVLEAVVGDDPGQIARWIEDHARADEFGLGDEMRDRCRDAAAHRERSRGSKTVVDPDDPRDRRRMEEARRRLGEIARHAIDDRWPRPWA